MSLVEKMVDKKCRQLTGVFDCGFSLDVLAYILGDVLDSSAPIYNDRTWYISSGEGPCFEIIATPDTL